MTTSARSASQEGPPPGRILVVTQDFGGGTGRHLSGMIRRWMSAGWEIEIVCQGVADAQMTDGLSLIPGPQLWRVRGFPIAQLRGLAQVRKRVRQFRPDIVHCFFFWSFVYGRLLRRMGLVSIVVENREDQGFNVLPWQYDLLRRTADIPDRVVCVSDAVRRVAMVKEGLRSHRTVVIRNGVEPATEPTDRAGARRALGVNGDVHVVGMVANLNRRIKGVEYFVDAMPLILRDVPDTVFFIFGDGTLRPELEARARALGVAPRVRFAGYHPDVARYYAAFDVSVLTSLSEGLSITLLESLQRGIPVVATRVGGNPEVVTDDETGFLVPPRNPVAFAQRVSLLLRDAALRARMGGAARRFVAQNFSAEAVASSYLTLFDALRFGQRHHRDAR